MRLPWRFFCSSMAPNRPMPRNSRTTGAWPCSAAISARITGSHARGVLDHALLEHDLEDSLGGGEAERVGVVGEAAPEHVVAEVVGDLVASRPWRRAAGTSW